MKKLFIFLSLLISVNCFAQDVILPKDSVTGKITYTDKIKVDSSSADQLYSKAKMWIAEAFKSAKDVIQLDDKDNHILIAKRTSKLYAKGLFGEKNFYGQYLNYSIKIECKDGRYKYTMTDYVLEQTETNPGSFKAENINRQKNNIYQQINDISTAMISDLKTAMAKSVASSKDW